MKQDVKIRVTGTQKTPEHGAEEADRLVTETQGRYRLVAGRHHVLYEEAQEGTRGITKTHIIADRDGLEVRRSGQTESVMVFRRGHRHKLSYKTPYGLLPMEVETRKLEFSEEEDELRIYAEYRIYSNGAEVTRNSSEIIVRSV